MRNIYFYGKINALCIFTGPNIRISMLLLFANVWTLCVYFKVYVAFIDNFKHCNRRFCHFHGECDPADLTCTCDRLNGIMLWTGTYCERALYNCSFYNCEFY